jgi:hypothetical protein
MDHGMMSPAPTGISICLIEGKRCDVVPDWGSAESTPRDRNDPMLWLSNDETTLAGITWSSFSGLAAAGVAP